MADTMPVLDCPFCQKRTQITPPALGDPVWRVYCAMCEVTQVLPAARYDTPASVVAQWQLLTQQLTLFG